MVSPKMLSAILVVMMLAFMATRAEEDKKAEDEHVRKALDLMCKYKKFKSKNAIDECVSKDDPSAGILAAAFFEEVYECIEPKNPCKEKFEQEEVNCIEGKLNKDEKDYKKRVKQFKEIEDCFEKNKEK